MSELNSFYSAIRKRSDENQKALDWLLSEKIYSLVGSIIRMELDSLFRLYYFNSRNENDKKTLLRQFHAGQPWHGEKRLVRDRDMVNLLARTLILDWATPIYDIGCAFIHLSPYHDWNNDNDPTRNISNDVRETIVEHVKAHHQKELSVNFTFDDLISITNDVFCKLRGNILCELPPNT